VGREIINRKEDGSQNGNTFLRHACSSKLCRRSGQLIFGVNPLYCMMVKTCAQKTSGKSQSMLSSRRANGGSNMRWRLDGRLAPLATFIRPEVPSFEGKCPGRAQLCSSHWRITPRRLRGVLRERSPTSCD